MGRAFRCPAARARRDRGARPERGDIFVRRTKILCGRAVLVAVTGVDGRGGICATDYFALDPFVVQGGFRLGGAHAS
ncbi:protein of unknown function [Rhodovastum atsumiense]|nr:protein of unknown function [Rhodovastum atsumiense]